MESNNPHNSKAEAIEQVTGGISIKQPVNDPYGPAIELLPAIPPNIRPAGPIVPAGLQDQNLDKWFGFYK